MELPIFLHALALVYLSNQQALIPRSPVSRSHTAPTVRRCHCSSVSLVPQPPPRTEGCDELEHSGCHEPHTKADPDQVKVTVSAG